MEENSPTEKRLLELLDIKDAELSDVASRLENLNREISFGLDWMRHTTDFDAEPAWTVPRLQMEVDVHSDYYMESVVMLILEQRGGTIRGIPLAYSKSSGSSAARFEAEFPVDGTLPDPLVSALPQLINDGCFFSEKMRLPLYVSIFEKLYRVTQLRPKLQLEAVPAPMDSGAS